MSSPEPEIPQQFHLVPLYLEESQTLYLSLTKSNSSNTTVGFMTPHLSRALLLSTKPTYVSPPKSFKICTIPEDLNAPQAQRQCLHQYAGNVTRMRFAVDDFKQGQSFNRTWSPVDGAWTLRNKLAGPERRLAVAGNAPVMELGEGDGGANALWQFVEAGSSVSSSSSSSNVAAATGGVSSAAESEVPTGSTQSNGLSAGIITGIVVGVLLAVLLLMGAMFLVGRRRRSKRRGEGIEGSPRGLNTGSERTVVEEKGPAELQAQPRSELEAQPTLKSLRDSGHSHELGDRSPGS